MFHLHTKNMFAKNVRRKKVALLVWLDPTHQEFEEVLVLIRKKTRGRFIPPPRIDVGSFLQNNKRNAHKARSEHEKRVSPPSHTYL
jgi:hypothetical protein